MEISKLFERDLNRMIKEIDQYDSEEDLWILEGEIKNTAGNLALHICGNLQHFIGAIMGHSGYIRDRDAEFSDKNIPVSVIKERIHTTIDVVRETLESLGPDELQAAYPHEVFGHSMTTHYFITHLYGHLNYHLGQINYHRRILSVNLLKEDNNGI